MTNRQTIGKWLSVVSMMMALVLMSAGSVGAQNQVVKQLNVLGTAVIHDKNLADSRQNAVNDALVAAVGQVMLEMLTGETVVRRFQLINDKVLVEKEAYIQNYRVLTESVSGGAVRTLVRVDVAKDRLSRDLSRLGLALSGTVYPRLLLMIAEKNVSAGGYAYWWGDRRQSDRTIAEKAMAETLAAAGFDIIAPPELNAPLGLAVNADEADLLAIADRLGAEVLVTGAGSASIAPNTMGGTIQTFEAVVEAKAINVKTRGPIGRTRQKAAASSQEAGAGGREALTQAGALVGDDLARQVMVAWHQDQERSTLIEVAVEGTGGHIASFVRLRTAISSISGVKELKMKEMSPDQAAMDVSYEGTARSLADALLLKTFTGFGIDIYEVTDQAVRIRLVN